MELFPRCDEWGIKQNVLPQSQCGSGSVRIERERAKRAMASRKAMVVDDVDKKKVCAQTRRCNAPGDGRWTT